MSDMDPNKLKVAELREELKIRGLDSKGTKPVLVKRLQQALNKEAGIVDDDSIDDGIQDEEAPDESSQDNDAGNADESAVDVDGNEDGENDVGDEEEEEEEEDQTEMPEGEFQTIDETSQDEQQPGESKTEDKEKKAQKRKRSRSKERRSRDRSRRSTSRSRDRGRRSPPPPKKVEMEDDSWVQSTDVVFDRYNCDLNLRIDENNVKAHPLTTDGFAFMWAGVRSTYGVTTGKVAFEVKIGEELSVNHLPSDEPNKHVVRVGFSTDATSLQLGEEPLSHGYGGTGKASTDCKFINYGEKFGTGDVITAYLDWESDPPTISYSKNGEDLGVCFEIDREEIGEAPLLAHILTKNTEFECNFGQNEEPYFPLKEEFVFLSTVDLEKRIRGSLPPAKKEDCEILMMVGLPGAGKTVWADKHAKSNPEKKFNVLGTNNIIEKMKVMGLPRKRNYAGRWDVLIDKSSKCLNRMIEVAARKKRNYILDQTNVYASARRRKMTPFEGFQRKAVVVVPTDEDFKRRISQREKEEGKDVPEKAVLEMKANFSAPEEGTLFDAVIYAELDKEEAKPLIEKYRKEGAAALPPPSKRFRGDRFGRGRFDRRDYRRGGGYGDRDRFSRGGPRGFRDRPSPRYNDRRGGGYSSSGGGSRGGYSSRGPRTHSRYDRRSPERRSGGYRQTQRYQGSGGQRSGSYGGSSGGGSWGSNRPYSGGQGSWGHQGNYGGQWGGSSSQSGYGNWGYGSGSNQSGGYGGGSSGGSHSQWGQNYNQNYYQGYGGGGSGGGGSQYNQWGPSAGYKSKAYSMYRGRKY